MSTFRQAIMRLAHQQSDLRKYLVPALRRTAREFSSPEELADYLKEHPKADKSRHTVKDSEGAAKKDEAPTKSDDGIGEPPTPQEFKKKIRGLPKPVQEKLEAYNLDVVGDDVDQAIEIATKLTEGIDKAADVCKLSPPVCKGNLGLARDKMPQIPGDMSVPDMLEATNKDGTPDEATRAKGKAAVAAGADPKDKRPILRQMLDTFKSEGVKIKPTKIPVGKLKATQSEIKAGKTFGFADAHLRGKFNNIADQIVVSSDGHILDGHHRWAALLTIDPNRSMNCIQVDMTMKEMLERADELPGVYREDFQGKPIDLPDDIKAKKDKYKSKAKGGDK